MTVIPAVSLGFCAVALLVTFGCLVHLIWTQDTGSTDPENRRRYHEVWKTGTRGYGEVYEFHRSFRRRRPALKWVREVHQTGYTRVIDSKTGEVLLELEPVSDPEETLRDMYNQ